jgi:hypothetical protein
MIGIFLYEITKHKCLRSNCSARNNNNNSLMVVVVVAIVVAVEVVVVMVRGETGK